MATALPKLVCKENKLKEKKYCGPKHQTKSIGDAIPWIIYLICEVIHLAIGIHTIIMIWIWSISGGNKGK